MGFFMQLPLPLHRESTEGSEGKQERTVGGRLEGMAGGLERERERDSKRDRHKALQLQIARSDVLQQIQNTYFLNICQNANLEIKLPIPDNWLQVATSAWCL